SVRQRPFGAENQHCKASGERSDASALSGHVVMPKPDRIGAWRPAQAAPIAIIPKTQTPRIISESVTPPMASNGNQRIVQRNTIRPVTARESSGVQSPI